MAIAELSLNSIVAQSSIIAIAGGYVMSLAANRISEQAFSQLRLITQHLNPYRYFGAEQTSTAEGLRQDLIVNATNYGPACQREIQERLDQVDLQLEQADGFRGVAKWIGYFGFFSLAALVFTRLKQALNLNLS